MHLTQQSESNASVSLQRDQSDALEYTVNIVRDITRRRLAEAELEAELADYKQLQAISTSLISQGDTTRLVEDIMDTAAVLTRADAATIQSLDPESNSLRLVASRGFARQFLDHFMVVTEETDSTCAVALTSHRRVGVTDFPLHCSQKMTATTRTVRSRW